MLLTLSNESLKHNLKSKEHCSGANPIADENAQPFNMILQKCIEGIIDLSTSKSSIVENPSLADNLGFDGNPVNTCNNNLIVNQNALNFLTLPFKSTEDSIVLNSTDLSNIQHILLNNNIVLQGLSRNTNTSKLVFKIDSVISESEPPLTTLPPNLLKSGIQSINTNDVESYTLDNDPNKNLEVTNNSAHDNITPFTNKLSNKETNILKNESTDQLVINPNNDVQEGLVIININPQLSINHQSLEKPLNNFGVGHDKESQPIEKVTNSHLESVKNSKFEEIHDSLDDKIELLKLNASNQLKATENEFDKIVKPFIKPSVDTYLSNVSKLGIENIIYNSSVSIENKVTLENLNQNIINSEGKSAIKNQTFITSMITNRDRIQREGINKLPKFVYSTNSQNDQFYTLQQTDKFKVSQETLASSLQSTPEKNDISQFIKIDEVNMKINSDSRFLEKSEALFNKILESENILHSPENLQNIETINLSLNGNSPRNDSKYISPSLALNIDDQIKVQVSNGLANDHQTIKFTLSPVDLGSVEIKFETDPTTGFTDITILTERSSTLDIVKQFSKEIEAVFNENGFKSENFTLNLSMQNNSENKEKFESDQENYPQESDLKVQKPTLSLLRTYDSNNSIDIMV